ncbi:ATP-grasp domain-containing protein [Methanosarcina sp. KYL-1]|uniref:ATP-grasp domain-containing protein n=1 Tax=Methanosarcina sp. KYL-1 TaxID=2602068 RepID=UPI002101ADFF|nr:ATP-grasp domain-containing protein [Methanosarcina sp. KYL-1]MCQ1537163.1 ATP-grasp domain-containing protein [Methanosarcina sp. KYL-1]
MQNVLIIGFDTRNIVCSAKRAGYTVCSIDAFMDQDLRECAYASAFLECRSPRELRKLDPARIKEQMETFGLEFDALVPGSGLEMLDSRQFSCPVLASSPKAVQEASDKAHLAKRLADLEMPHPRCYSLKEFEAIEYPVMLKPARGGGGIFNRVAGNRQELLAALEELSRLDPEFREEEMVIQEFVRGIPASVSVLATEDKALAVAVNEQLIGIPWLSRLPFAYCGNITPFKTEHAGKMERLAEELVLEFGLMGSNGVDFLVTEEGPVVLEINPRFQGSLDTVERATDLNLFEAHAGCFRGELPEKTVPKRFAARGVLYSDRELFIDQTLMDIILREESADVPSPGAVTEPDGPLTSLFACASTREEALLGLERGAERIKAFIERAIKTQGESLSPTGKV